MKKTKTYNLPDTDKITSELNLADGRTIRSEIHTNVLILFDARNKCLNRARSQLLFVCLFVFLPLQPIVVVFSQPGIGL